MNLGSIVATQAGSPVAPEISGLADLLHERYGEALLAVLAYGSCLRDTSFDESLIDLYALVSDYRATHGPGIQAFANRLLPPNVYYLEHTGDDRTLRSKYAIVTLDQFEQKVSPSTPNPYFWARFAQPCALVYARDETTSGRVHAALATAARTAYANGCNLAGPDAGWRTVWTALFAATYRTELRPESTSRAASIVDHCAEYFERISTVLEYERTQGAADPSSATEVHANWFMRRLAGKTLSIARLIKAGMTFSGGADYLAWKISRHSGVVIKVTPWQRRHPILAALMMAPRLYRKGGFR